MSARRHRSAWLVATLLVAIIPGHLRGQAASADDPCFTVLTGWSSLGVLQDVDIADVERLVTALRKGDLWIADRLIYLTARQQEIAAGKPLTAAERSEWQRIRDCLPWLSDALGRISKAASEAGIASILSSDTDGRSRVSLPPEEFGTMLKRRILELQQGLLAGLRGR